MSKSVSLWGQDLTIIAVFGMITVGVLEIVLAAQRPTPALATRRPGI